MYAMPTDELHGKGRPGVWLAAAPGNQPLMIRDRPERFFKPPYVGAYGWIGVWLDKRPAWTEVAELVADSWRLTAPKKTVDRPAAKSPAKKQSKKIAKKK